MDKIRLLTRKILMVLLVFWMIAVFYFSHQTGEESSNLSRSLANFISKGDTVKAENYEPVVRKVAHMTEYSIGAMIFYGITLTFPKISRKRKLIYTIIFILLYASTDELHQKYIVDRSGNVIDVFVDLFGAAMGIVGILIVEATIIMMDNKIKEDLENPKLEK